VPRRRRSRWPRRSALEQRARLGDPAAVRQRGGQPERAGQELALVAVEAVVGLRGRVARDEPVTAQLVAHRVDRPGDAGVVAGQEADEREVEDAGVERLRSVVLGERAAFRIPALVADLLVDRVARRPPALQRRLQLEALGEAHRAVEDDPGHDLGVGVVTARAAALPDPVVGLLPDAGDVLDDRAPARPEFALDPAGEVDADGRDGEGLAEDVELELLGGRVPDPDRLRALVAGQLGQLELGQAPLAADPVHDLDLGRVAGPDAQVRGVAEQRREARRRVEVGQAQPVDRPSRPTSAAVWQSPSTA
jgi:hypothetical protein